MRNFNLDELLDLTMNVEIFYESQESESEY
jgi:hypothetical protein